MFVIAILAGTIPGGTARLASSFVIAVLLSMLLSVNVQGADAGVGRDTVSAVWTPQEFQFKVDVSDQYTCREFRDTVKEILLALGARKELQVGTTPCVNSQINYGDAPGKFGVPMYWKDGPSGAPQVLIRMQVLKTLDESRPDPGGIGAHWESVNLVGRHEPLDYDECKLAKQVVQTLLPLFSTRNVEYNSPHCNNIGGGPAVHLRLEVLVTDQK